MPVDENNWEHEIVVVTSTTQYILRKNFRSLSVSADYIVAALMEVRGENSVFTIL